MKFGFSVPTLTTFPKSSEPEGGWRTRYARAYEMCELAEEMGYDHATLGHHRFKPDVVHSSAPFVVLAALAARTRKLRFTTSIALLPLQNPVEFAEQAATLDELSDGRLNVGVGLGYRPYEFEAIGLDYKKRVSLLEENIELVRLCWQDAPVTFTGKHYALHNADVAPKPVQKPGPPIWIGAQVQSAVRRAATHGDGYIVDSTEAAIGLIPKIHFYRETCRSLGKKPGAVVFNRKVGIGESREQVEAEWLPAALDVYREYIRVGVPMEDKDFAERLASGKKLTLADCPKGQFVAGTPADCIETIEWLREETDCDYIVADFGRGSHGVSYERARARFELFGRTVIPALGESA